VFVAAFSIGWLNVCNASAVGSAGGPVVWLMTRQPLDIAAHKQMSEQVFGFVRGSHG